MKVIVTGRIFDGKVLVAYKVVSIRNNTFVFGVISKCDIDKFQLLNCRYNSSTKSITSIISIPISEYPRYDVKINRINHRYTDSDIVAKTLQQPVENIRLLICGALIYGAISDPLCDKAQKHAELYYEEIRHRTTDIIAIAKNTHFSEKDILTIKNYLFMESHMLDTGYKRFDASFDIASSWQRFIENRAEKHDITLLKHELFEINLVKAGLSQREAHNYAENKYNYGKESNEYYDRLKKH